MSASIPRVAAGERIYAIGDVHGRADLLDALLDRIEQDVARCTDGRRTRLVLLGDYVDRGEESPRVLDRVAQLAGAGAACLRGNHEAALLDFVADPVQGAAWLEMGGLQTLAAYGVRPPRLRDPDDVAAAATALVAAMGPRLDLLHALATTDVSGTVVFVHAALAPGRPLAAQEEATMLWGNRRFLAEGWDDDWLVVHGHYAAAEPVEARGRICVDTGAYYSGRLTAVRLDDGIAFLST